MWDVNPSTNEAKFLEAGAKPQEPLDRTQTVTSLF